MQFRKFRTDNALIIKNKHVLQYVCNTCLFFIHVSAKLQTQFFFSSFNKDSTAASICASLPLKTSAGAL